MSERVRIQFEADKRLMDDIERLSGAAGTVTRAELLRRALMCYREIERVRDMDGEVILLRKDGTRERLVVV